MAYLYQDESLDLTGCRLHDQYPDTGVMDAPERQNQAEIPSQTAPCYLEEK